jgi:hypothetical protein
VPAASDGPHEVPLVLLEESEEGGGLVETFVVVRNTPTGGELTAPAGYTFAPAVSHTCGESAVTGSALVSASSSAPADAAGVGQLLYKMGAGSGKGASGPGLAYDVFSYVVCSRVWRVNTCQKLDPRVLDCFAMSCVHRSARQSWLLSLASPLISLPSLALYIFLSYLRSRLLTISCLSSRTRS